MNDRERQACLWQIIDALGDSNKTKLQKLVYFLQEWRQVALGYRFTLHHYGPFSSELDTDLLHLRMEGYVTVEMDPSGYGFHVKRTGQTPESESGAGTCSTAIAETLESFGDKETSELEVAATAHFVARVTESSNIDEVVERVAGLKPRYAHQYIDRITKETLSRTL